MSDTLDAIDRSILSMLQEDARTPYVKIADHLSVSDATIHIRVRKLVNKGIIKQFTVLLDEGQVGQSVTTYVLVRVEPGSIEQVCEALSKLENVYEIYEVHERYDILVKVKGDSLNEFRDVLTQEIRSIPHILGSEAYTVYKTWKQKQNIPVQ
jgi:Lrp/AsnC family transcriptional regulator for asnA, asnC and gidA